MQKGTEREIWTEEGVCVGLCTDFHSVPVKIKIDKDTWPESLHMSAKVKKTFGVSVQGVTVHN